MPVSGPAREDLGVRVEKANKGQLKPKTRTRLLNILSHFNGRNVFLTNKKMMPVKKGRKVASTFNDENLIPIKCRPQMFSQAVADTVNEQVDLWLETGAARPSTSSWCSRVVVASKSDGSFRVCIDYRALNPHMKSDSGDMGDMAGMHDRMQERTFSPCLTWPKRIIS